MNKIAETLAGAYIYIYILTNVRVLNIKNINSNKHRSRKIYVHFLCA